MPFQGAPDGGSTERRRGVVLEPPGGGELAGLLPGSSEGTTVDP